ncbi:26S proteasome non-ATPase regulatory subunit 10 [Pelomyxa schiedti]|nr:26S proteasome non-ATPase regulatory subunit 10 [Pelomyxa schiedti]
MDVPRHTAPPVSASSSLPRDGSGVMVAIMGGGGETASLKIEALENAVRELTEKNQQLLELVDSNRVEMLELEAVNTCLRDQLTLKKELIDVEKKSFTQLRASFQEVFRSLPLHTIAFESGKVHVAPKSSAAVNAHLTISFGKIFDSPPHVSAWVTKGPAGFSYKLQSTSITDITRNSFGIIGLNTEETDFNVDWVAYVPASTNNKTASLIQLVEVSPTFSPELKRTLSAAVTTFGVDQVDISGTTLLHAACHCGNYELVKWLLSCGAHVDSVDRHGWTPLLSAVSTGQTKIAWTLLKRGAEPTAKTNDGRHSLHLLCRSSSNLPPLEDPLLHKVVRTILKSGVDPKVQYRGASCLFLAVRSGNCALVKELLNKGKMNPNTIDNDGFTPLHIAVMSKNTLMTRVLLESNANPSIQTNVGQPSQLAQQSNNLELIHVFESLSSRKGIMIPLFTVVEILSLLPPRDLYRCRRVCRDFLVLVDEISNSPSYWESRNLRKDQFLYCEKFFKQFSSGLGSFIVEGSPKPTEIELSCMILGEFGVGAMTLAYQFCRKESRTPFDNDYPPRMILQTNTKVVGLTVFVRTHDESIRFTDILIRRLKRCHLFMVCFSLEDAFTFDQATSWLKTVDRFGLYHQTAARVLIGTHTDSKSREVTVDQASQLAQEYGGVYVETCPITGYNVDLAFKVGTELALAGEALRAEQELAETKRREEAERARAKRNKGRGRGRARGRGRNPVGATANANECCVS